MIKLGVEEYALRHGRLHAQARAFLQQYFDIGLYRVKVNAKYGKTSALGTSVWVLAGTIMAQRGRLNAEFGSVSQAIDLATVRGMKVLAHECFHVQQWLTRPWWRMTALFVGDVFRSLWGARRLWSHAHSKLEQEAIAFVRSITPDLYKRDSNLKIFESLR